MLSLTSHLYLIIFVNILPFKLGLAFSPNKVGVGLYLQLYSDIRSGGLKWADLPTASVGGSAPPEG